MRDDEIVRGGSTKLNCELREALDINATLDDFMEKNSTLYCRYARGVRDIYQLRARKNYVRRDMIVVWLAGPTGCGKTKFCYDYCQRLGIIPWCSGHDLKYMDGYIN